MAIVTPCPRPVQPRRPAALDWGPSPDVDGHSWELGPAGDRPDVAEVLAVGLAARASCYRELGTPAGDLVAGELAAVVAELRAAAEGGVR
jgi:hypothetical protein